MKKMSKEEIEKEVLDIINNQVDMFNHNINVTKDSKVKEDLNFDSLDLIDLVRETELKLCINISEEEYLDLFREETTVQDIIILAQNLYEKQNIIK